jgi:hypothetical protein
MGLVPRYPGAQYWDTQQKKLFVWDGGKDTGDWVPVGTGAGGTVVYTDDSLSGNGAVGSPLSVKEIIKQYDALKPVWPSTGGYQLGSVVHGTIGDIEGIFKLAQTAELLWLRRDPYALQMGIARSFNPGDYFYISTLGNTPFGDLTAYNGIYQVKSSGVSIVVTATNVADLSDHISGSSIVKLTRPFVPEDPQTDPLSGSAQPWLPNTFYSKGTLRVRYVDDDPSNPVQYNQLYEAFIDLDNSFAAFSETGLTTQWRLLADITNQVSGRLIGSIMGWVWTGSNPVLPPGYLPCDGRMLSKTVYTRLYEVAVACGWQYGSTSNSFAIPTADNQVIFVGVV